MPTKKTTTKPAPEPPAKISRKRSAPPEEVTEVQAEAGTQDSSRPHRVTRAGRSPSTSTAVGQPGHRLVQLIHLEMARRGISHLTQVSAEMGFTDDPRALFLSRMQSGQRAWSTASLERLRMVADWLDIAPLEVMMLADVISPDDALVNTPIPSELDRLASRIAMDPEYKNMLPHYADIGVLPPWAKVLLLILYDDVNRFRVKAHGPSAGVPRAGLLALARRLPK